MHYIVKNKYVAEEIERTYKITAKQFTEEGIKFRILYDTKPSEEAKIAEITLEDAYININNNEQKL